MSIEKPLSHSARSDTTPTTDGELHIRSELKCGKEVMRCQFNREGTLLAVGLSDGTIKLFCPGNGDPLMILRDMSSARSSMSVTGLRFISSSQSHCLLLAADAGGSLSCWYPWDCGNCLWTFSEADKVGNVLDGGPGARRESLCLSVSPSGDTAATGGSDPAVHLYDVRTQQRVLTCRASSCRTVMDGHRSRVFAVTFHPERENEFISAGWDNTIQFWDSRQERAVRRIYGPHVCGQSIDIDPKRNYILSGSWRTNNQLEVWDYSSGKKVCDVTSDPGEDSKIYTCHWLGESHMVAGGTQSNTLKVISRSSLKTESRLSGLLSPVFSASVCLAGSCSGLIAATSGCSVYLLDRCVPSHQE